MNNLDKSISQLFKEYCDKVDKVRFKNKGTFIICSQKLANILNKIKDEQHR